MCLDGNINLINKNTFAKKFNNLGFEKVRKRLKGSKNPVAHYKIKDCEQCYYSELNESDMYRVTRLLKGVS